MALRSHVFTCFTGLENLALRPPKRCTLALPLWLPFHSGSWSPAWIQLRAVRCFASCEELAAGLHHLLPGRDLLDILYDLAVLWTTSSHNWTCCELHPLLPGRAGLHPLRLGRAVDYILSLDLPGFLGATWWWLDYFMDYLLELPGLMADDEKKERGFDSYIPVWDGRSDSLRDFNRSVVWWLSSIDLKKTTDFNLAARFAMRQKGSAKLRAVEFDPKQLEYKAARRS